MRQRGFTLIETLVAISLLTVGVAGSFSLMQKVTSFASISSSQLVASYLAQEGIETIRNIRDTNYLEGEAWDTGIATGFSYFFDYRSSTFPDYTCGSYLQYNGTNYICSSDASGKFQRKITIDRPVPDKMIISIEVSWSERGIPHKILAQTELRDWR